MLASRVVRTELLPALNTRGFLNQKQLLRHFEQHGTDFGASNAQEYEQMADAFLGAPLSSTVHECRRRDGDRIRYNPMSQEYGVLGHDEMIRTYYKPVPCIDVPFDIRSDVARAGKCHGYANNFQYFQQECKKRGQSKG